MSNRLNCSESGPLDASSLSFLLSPKGHACDPARLQWEARGEDQKKPSALRDHVTLLFGTGGLHGGGGRGSPDTSVLRFPLSVLSAVSQDVNEHCG